MEFRILGPLEVLKDRQRVSLPKGRGRGLLALLVLRAGEVVSSDRLIDELWGEIPPATATNALQNLVSGLRKRLEPGWASGALPTVLETHVPGYRLAIDPGQVDANRFRHLLAEAREAPIGEKATMFHRALTLWRGPALADFVYEPFAQAAIAELEELRLTAIEERIDADLAIGRHAEVAAELHGLAADHPLRERLAEQQMLALYRSGRQAEALGVYTTTRRTLIEELGIEPGTGLHQLQGSILRQDASLDLKAAPFVATSQRARSASEELGAQPWLPEERKTVTVVFVDVTASTSAGRAPDAEAARQHLRRFIGTAADVVTGHGGNVEEVVGDALVGAFGIPTAREDDALRAVRAAVDLLHALAALNNELASDGEIRLAARVGINTGEVVVGEQAMRKIMASGATFKAAARLQQSAAEGEILVGAGTRWLVQNAVVLEPAASFAVAGVETHPTAWKLLGMVPGAPLVARRLDASMVGRAPELSRLRAAYDRAVRERTTHRFSVLGEAGIGKSRLAREFGATVGSETLLLTGHCPAYGDGITFWPLREVVVEAAGGMGRDALLDVLATVEDAESIADQVAGAIGAAAPGRPDGLFPALRRFFEALARERPVAVIFEDMHWAQPTLLDLVEYLADGTPAPVFLLCVARPELLEQRSAWAGGTNAASLLLEPLGSEDSQKLIADRLGGRPLPAETVTRIVQTAQGNPLFAEQMLAALGEEGQVSVPASVQALLAARLDRLGPAERDLIRSASVLGTDFSLAALMPLIPDEGRLFAVRHLEALERRGLMLPSPRSALGKEAFRFRHDLIQLAAYRSMTKATRAELHQRVAQWFQGEATRGTPEFEEIIGYHLEQAHHYLRELDQFDARARALGVRAGEQLASAGLGSFARFDAAAAVNLLSRAKALLPQDHPLRSKLRRSLAEAYEVMGRHADADAMLAELLEQVRATEDSRLEYQIRLERTRTLLATGPDPTSLDAIRDEAEEAFRVFDGADDEAGLSQACHVLGLVHLRLGELPEMEEVARRGLTHAERSGIAREELGARWAVSMALLAGATPVKACIRSCQELVRWRGTENPGVLADLAVLRSMLGEFDEARELIDRSRRLLAERMRARRPLGALARRAAEVEIIAGDLAAGERELRTALELGREMGERDQVSQIAASLSQILSVRGATEEAAIFASLSADHAPAQSVAAQALWRAATARVLANREDFQKAERLARDAIQLIPLEMRNLAADLRVNLADVLLATGVRDAALKAISEAVDLFGRKGNVAAAIQARSLAG